MEEKRGIAKFEAMEMLEFREDGEGEEGSWENLGEERESESGGMCQMKLVGIK